MKRISLFFAALLVTVSLAGCGDKEKETEPQTLAVTEAPTTKQTETQTQTTEPQTESSTDKTRELNGLVTGVTADSVDIQTARGKKLTFSTTGAQMQTTAELKAGSQITILYKGKVVDTDTSGAKVSGIKDMDASAEKITEGEPVVAETADPNATGGTLNGTISEITGERIVILGDDGDSYYFTHDKCKMVLGNGIQDTNYVSVKFTGDVYGPEIVPAVEITDNTTNSAPQTENSTKVTGTITDVTMSTLSISADDGQELSFTITGVPINITGGLMIGETVGINYTGDVSSAKVTSITDTSGGSTNTDAGSSNAESNASSESNAATEAGQNANNNASANDAADGNNADANNAQ
ncbi:lipoprotein [Robinsoniella peoriensis]|uniref:LptM family lipoprotein n=1 Tax=Robinsoniella peoriensis TaxID=180332 RepID=UPI0005C7D812|nr:hypothetical protein [Robinsoniella peoriensis]